MKERRVAFVMAARLNSQRVPNKMLKPFGGTTLWDIALDKVFDSGIPYEDIFFPLGDYELVDKVTEKVTQRFKRDGENSPSWYPTIIHRSRESCNATNDPNVPDSLKLLYEWYKELMNQGYTHVVLFNPCHPLVKPETIKKFYDDFNEGASSDQDGMFSVITNKNYFWDHSGRSKTEWNGSKLMNTRRVEVTYEGAHVLYGSKLSFIEDECWMGDTSPPKPELYILDKYEAFDIDTPEDFEAAEALYNVKKYEWKHKLDYGLKVIDVTPEDEGIICRLNVSPIGYNKDGKPFYSNPQCGETKELNAEYFEFEVPLVIGDVYTRTQDMDTGAIEIRIKNEEE